MNILCLGKFVSSAVLSMRMTGQLSANTVANKNIAMALRVNTF